LLSAVVFGFVAFYSICLFAKIGSNTEKKTKKIK